MRIINLTLKDISQILRDKRSFLFMLLMPVVFTAFMGFALGRSSTANDQNLALGWINQDGNSLLSQQLHSSLQTSSALKLVELDESQAEEQVQQGKLAAALKIPTGFSQQTLAGEKVQLTLFTDDASSTGQTIHQIVQTVLMRSLSTVEIARLVEGQTENSEPYASQAVQQTALLQTLEQANQAWQKPEVTITVVKAQLLYDTTSAAKANSFTQSSPGMIVQFAIFGLVNTAVILVNERKSKTLQRLLTTSINRAGIISGHLVAMFLIVLLQGLVLVAFGQIFLGVNYLRQPLAVLVMVAALAFWIACMGLAIGVLVKGEEQVLIWSMLAMFLFSALGGCWFPLESSSGAFSVIGHWMPSAWAMNGFQNIVVRGLGFSSILLPASILTGYALAFFGLAIWRFDQQG
ncbi:MAG TPA: ABC transporter permease [Anaerolineaceae bacterium]|nr:ABC transporter permease [Anaerolineaceae bacterium]